MPGPEGAWLEGKGEELTDEGPGPIVGAIGTVSTFGPGRRVACDIPPPTMLPLVWLGNEVMS